MAMINNISEEEVNKFKESLKKASSSAEYFANVVKYQVDKYRLADPGSYAKNKLQITSNCGKAEVNDNLFKLVDINTDEMILSILSKFFDEFKKATQPKPKSDSEKKLDTIKESDAWKTLSGNLSVLTKGTILESINKLKLEITPEDGSMDESKEEDNKSLDKINKNQSDVKNQVSDSIVVFAQKSLTASIEAIKNAIKNNSDLDKSQKDELNQIVDKAESKLNERKFFSKIAEAKRLTANIDTSNPDGQLEASKIMRQAIGATKDDVLAMTNSFTGVLESFGIEIPDAVKEILGGLDDVIGGFAEMDVTKPMSIITGSLKVVAGVGKTIGAIFGASDNGYKVSQKLIDHYEALTKIIKDVIAVRKKSIITKVGQDAQEEADKAEMLLKKQQAASRKMFKERMKERSKNAHSKGYRLVGELKQYRRQLAAVGIDLDEIGRRGLGLADLDVEKLRKLKEEYPDIWATFNNNQRDPLDAIIAAGDEMKEIQKSLKEALTSLSLDSLLNEFDSLLLNANTTMDQISDNFEDHMRDAILNIYKANVLRGKLTAWYDDFAKRAEDGEISERDVKALREQYHNIYKDAQDEINSRFDAAGLELEGSKQREASAKGFASMSQDSADELNGRFTAIQGHTFSMNEKMGIIVNQKAEILNIITPFGENLNLLRENSNIALKHLSNIDTNTGRLYAIESALNSINQKGVLIRS